MRLAASSANPFFSIALRTASCVNVSSIYPFTGTGRELQILQRSSPDSGLKRPRQREHRCPAAGTSHALQIPGATQWQLPGQAAVSVHPQERHILWLQNGQVGPGAGITTTPQLMHRKIWLFPIYFSSAANASRAAHRTAVAAKILRTSRRLAARTRSALQSVLLIHFPAKNMCKCSPETLGDPGVDHESAVLAEGHDRLVFMKLRHLLRPRSFFLSSGSSAAPARPF